ncbi:MAG: flagellar type III secretion system pore protein FliP [Planctomycetota bacterium]|jgi:flagellar biosynthetic protein FliP|nr:flagellar type III secretion system pore protein FliP [Planctomycetota bacterium]MDR1520147.1 flagellar type III secretion system pore protein FliP [Planctomycetota bacterium]
MASGVKTYQRTGNRGGALFFFLAFSTLSVKTTPAADLGVAPREPREALEELGRSEMDFVPAIERGDPNSDGLLYLPLPTIENGSLVPMEKAEQLSSMLQIAVILTIITLSPSILIMMTSFLRITVVMGFVRRAMGTQSLPPDQVMMGLSLFLTFFIMWPTWKAAWKDGLAPYFNGEYVQISPGEMRRLRQAEALERSMAPIRKFMLECLAANDGREELYFFLGAAGMKDAASLENQGRLLPADIPTTSLIPAFICSELKRAFWMGFLLYLPFLVLDVVISSILMAMGMMMLPPVMISLPFKIIIFVIVDGWRLLFEGMITSFPVSVIQDLIAPAAGAVGAGLGTGGF